MQLEKRIKIDSVKRLCVQGPQRFSTSGLLQIHTDRLNVGGVTRYMTHSDIRKLSVLRHVTIIVK